MNPVDTSIKIDTLIIPKWIIPVEPKHAILQGHALAIHDGKIHDIAPVNKCQERYDANEVIRLEQHALLPGFINCHTHAAMNLLKGYADDLVLMEWLNNHIWPAEQKWLSREYVHDGTTLAIAEMILSGTTCFNDMYFYPDVITKVVKAIGIRAQVGLCASIMKTEYAHNVEEHLNYGMQTYNQYRNDPLLSFSLAPHAVYTVQEDEFKYIRSQAQNHKLRIQIHLQETANEVYENIEKHGLRPTRYLAELGILDLPFVAIHMTQVDDEDINLLQKYNCHVIHCPQSNMKLASGYCPTYLLLNAGINVALGTDGAASNNDLDMLEEMRIASLLAKLNNSDPTTLSASETLEMATINGAKALGLESITGSLVKGKAADCIAINLHHIITMPNYNPLAQIVYAASREQITDLWVAGKQLLANRTLTTIDKTALFNIGEQWQRKIKSGDN